MRGNLPAYQGAEKIDDYTVDIKVTENYPLLLNDLTNIFIFDKEWLVANNALAPTDVGDGVEGYATTHANGTGPFKVVSRKPDVETVFEVNKDWWDKPRAQYRPDRLHADRLARDRASRRCCRARSTYMDKAPLQDMPRLKAVAGRQGARQQRAAHGVLPVQPGGQAPVGRRGDKNPFNDIKVREALYRAIDIDVLQKKVMRGLSRNTGSMVAPGDPGLRAGARRAPGL